MTMKLDWATAARKQPARSKLVTAEEGRTTQLSQPLRVSTPAEKRTRRPQAKTAGHQLSSQRWEVGVRQGTPGLSSWEGPGFRRGTRQA